MNGLCFDVCKSMTCGCGDHHDEYMYEVMAHDHSIGNSRADFWEEYAALQASCGSAHLDITGYIDAPG